MDSLADFFGGRSSVAFAVLLRNTHRRFGENIPFFGAFFGALFGAFFGEQLFASKSAKFAQNAFCKRGPLIWLPKNVERTNASKHNKSYLFPYWLAGPPLQIVRGFAKGWFSKSVVLADVPWIPKPERRYKKKRNDGPQNRNEGTKNGTTDPKNRNEGTMNGTTVPKPGTRAHLPKPPFYKTSLLFPLESSRWIFSFCVRLGWRYNFREVPVRYL